MADFALPPENGKDAFKLLFLQFGQFGIEGKMRDASHDIQRHNAAGVLADSIQPLIGGQGIRLDNFNTCLDKRVALLGLRLTPCQWSILYQLLAHPLLADLEMAVFLNLQRASLRCSLYALHRLGCAEGISTAMRKRRLFCDRGLCMIAAANPLPLHNLAILEEAPTSDQSRLVRRGESWLLRHIQHNTGTYGFFAALSQAARQQPVHDLCFWETGAMFERCYQINKQWYNLRPDVLAEYRAEERKICFWLEWDRGTMNVRDLITKCTAYTH
jgi:hypothetical protein